MKSGIANKVNGVTFPSGREKASVCTLPSPLPLIALIHGHTGITGALPRSESGTVVLMWETSGIAAAAAELRFLDRGY